MKSAGHGGDVEVAGDAPDVVDRVVLDWDGSGVLEGALALDAVVGAGVEVLVELSDDDVHAAVSHPARTMAVAVQARATLGRIKLIG